MSIHASCATCRSSWRVTLAVRPEKNCHQKSDDRSEADPPREFHYWEPAWLFIKFRADHGRDLIRQSAQDRHDDEAADHGDDIAAVVPARLGQHSRKKDTEQRAVGVAENPKHDRNNEDAGMRDHEISSG